VTLLLHSCHTLVTLLSHSSYILVTLLLHACYTIVTLLLHCRNSRAAHAGGGAGHRLAPVTPYALLFHTITVALSRHNPSS
jgi:hypothetical protein